MTRYRALFAALLAVLAVLAVSARSSAAPEAHILRIDPRAGIANGAPLLTTVTEVVEFSPFSDAIRPCANVTGFNASVDCLSNALEKPNAIWKPLPFPEDRARLLVAVGGGTTFATVEPGVKKWKDAKNEKGVGTAWLVAVDAAASMSSRYGEARAIARQFIEAMGPNDLMNLQIFDDRQTIQASKWKTYKERNDLVATLNAQASVAPSHGKDRALFDQLKTITSEGFNSLGNIAGPAEIPLHQAMVVLSNGSGRGDAASAAPSAAIFNQYVTKGRFPEDNTSVPKTPLPVISIWLPQASGLVNDAFRNNDQQFMQQLANPQIGGFFDIVRDGQGEGKGKTIVGLVKRRFDEMYIVRWRLSCLNPTISQSFDLQFQNTVPQIKGDATFKDVPIGVDPSQWPLDIDLARTKAEADANPVHPAGTMKVYGNFCWGGDSKRAEAYFIPAGSKPNPNATSSDLKAVQRAQQNLIAQNMHSTADQANDSFAIFKVPDEETMLEGAGEAAVVRVLIYDNGAHRASGHDEKTILTLKATKKPFNLLFILGIAGGVIIILLLVVVLLRGGGGGKGRKGGGRPPPAPVMAGGGGYAPPGYGGAPPPGGGYPPQGGGGPYASSGVDTPSPAFAAPALAYAGAAPAAPAYAPMMPAPAAPAPAISPAAMPPAPMFAAPPMASPAVAAAVLQVRCPSCQSMTMATPGQPSVCFSCGQPLPMGLTGGGGAGQAPTFPLTGGVPVHPMQPPPSPYGASTAVLSGAPGEYSIGSGAEVRVGRDPAQCGVSLGEPRVSGVHATLKVEGGQLWVRDESSNNGTHVDGSRIPAGVWVVVPAGAVLRFGPVEFTTRLV